jgi:hypothetical protein
MNPGRILIEAMMMPGGKILQKATDRKQTLNYTLCNLPQAGEMQAEDVALAAPCTAKATRFNRF